MSHRLRFQWNFSSLHENRVSWIWLSARDARVCVCVSDASVSGPMALRLRWLVHLVSNACAECICRLDFFSLLGSFRSCFSSPSSSFRCSFFSIHCILCCVSRTQAFLSLFAVHFARSAQNSMSIVTMQINITQLRAYRDAHASTLRHSVKYKYSCRRHEVILLLVCVGYAQCLPSLNFVTRKKAKETKNGIKQQVISTEWEPRISSCRMCEKGKTDRRSVQERERENDRKWWKFRLSRYFVYYALFFSSFVSFLFSFVAFSRVFGASSARAFCQSWVTICTNRIVHCCRLRRERAMYNLVYISGVCVAIINGICVCEANRSKGDNRSGCRADNDRVWNRRAA